MAIARAVKAICLLALLITVGMLLGWMMWDVVIHPKQQTEAYAGDMLHLCREEARKQVGKEWPKAQAQIDKLKADVENLQRLISLCVTEENLKKLHLPAGTSVEWLNNDEHGKPVPLTYYEIKQAEVEALRMRMDESDKRISELTARMDSLANITYRQWSESHGSRSVSR
jgi:predicted RNase H-like nuclease (RuvC/YqgF family)